MKTPRRAAPAPRANGRGLGRMADSASGTETARADAWWHLRPTRPPMERSSLITRTSLLQSLRRADDDDAWREFFRLYRGLIVGYARTRGCTDDQAKEVLQQTMISLVRVMPCFEYDRSHGKFRSFLLKIVHDHIMDSLRWSRKTRAVPLDEGAATQILDEGHRPDPAPWDRRFDQNLLAQALERVRGRVDARTYRSFDLYVLQGKPAPEVAEALALQPNAVYQHRNRVIAMLQREVAALRRELGEPAP